MIGKEYITPEKFHKYIDRYACPYDFGFETEYSKFYCGEGYYQGDCKKCWDSEVIETNCKPNGCLENIDKDRVN